MWICQWSVDLNKEKCSKAIVEFIVSLELFKPAITKTALLILYIKKP